MLFQTEKEFNDLLQASTADVKYGFRLPPPVPGDTHEIVAFRMHQALSFATQVVRSVGIAERVSVAFGQVGASDIGGFSHYESGKPCLAVSPLICKQVPVKVCCPIPRCCEPACCEPACCEPACCEPAA